MADRRHHGEGEHDQRHVAMPTVPGAGLVVIGSEFILDSLEAVLDRPTVPFDEDEGFDARSDRAPGGEERQVAVGDAATDQQPAGPQARSLLVIFGGVEIGELEIGPVMESRALGSLARRQPPPSGGIEASSDLICGADDGGFAGPGSEVMVGVDPEYVALAGTAQRLLVITHTIDAVGRHPGERDRLTVQRGLEVEVGEEVGA